MRVRAAVARRFGSGLKAAAHRRYDAAAHWAGRCGPSRLAVEAVVFVADKHNYGALGGARFVEGFGYAIAVGVVFD